MYFSIAVCSLSLKYFRKLLKENFMNQVPASARVADSVVIDATRENDMFEIVTKGSKYLIVVTDPARRNIALLTDSESVPSGLALCRLMGTVVGGTLATGCIAIGSRMSIQDNADITGSCIISQTVTDIRPTGSPLQAAHIIAKARRSFTEEVEKIIAKEFAADNRETVRKMINHFGNAAGKSMALGVLARANKHGKLREAMELLEKYWARFWEIEFTEVAGDPGTPANEARWQMFYVDAGVPPPM